jgi:hypothetical protein
MMGLSVSLNHHKLHINLSDIEPRPPRCLMYVNMYACVLNLITFLHNELRNTFRHSFNAWPYFLGN